MIRKYFFITVCCLAAVFFRKAQLDTDSLVAVNNRKITGFLDRKIAASEAGRAGYWHRDFSSPEAYRQSVETNRERLKFITGVRDVRVSGEPELCAGINRSAVVAETETHLVFAVRWQVFDDFFAEGLFLKPRTGIAKQTVIHLPHAGVSPEQLLGMEGDDADSGSWFPFPAGDEQLFIPVTVDRRQEKRGRIYITNREYVYRAAYQLGRHIIGYEVQETLALVDWLKQSSPEMKIRVEGQGDGALIAFYAAAMDTRIDEAIVVDYFDRRDRVCDEVIDRNVFGLLQQFGDAEIASLICPRKLTVGLYKAPELTLPENEPWGSAYGGAPGKLQKQPPKSVEAEVSRAKKLTAPLRAGWIDYTPRMRRMSRPGVQTAAGLDPVSAAGRMERIVTAMDRHTAHLLDHSVLTRREFWKELDTSSPEKIAETVDGYLAYFSKNVVGEFDDTLLPLNPRVRLVNESETYKVYQVELDVFEGLSAYGLMLVPNSLKEGERLPVVLCQHGLERFCSSHVREYALETDGPYTSQICEHGYIAFAPQGIFALSHKFRFNQRQLNSLGSNLFAIMTAQYRQYVRFLQSQPFVEGSQIGFYGCSYGGTTAMFVPPNVPEIGPTVCSANFNYWNFKCANGLFDRDYRSDWQYEVFDYDLANTFDHSDMARLIAPRPFMVERGHDDGVAYDEYVGFEFGKVRYYYDVYLKMPERAEIHFEPGGHFPFLTHALPFLDKWLKKSQTKPSADEVYKDRARGIVLPESDGHYKNVKDYVEDEPDADYIHASEAAHEAFRDIKFSIRIHWGVYSKWGIEASWPYLQMSNEKKTEYNELYKTFNPQNFDAEEWMALFKRCGMQAFAFTTKHHDGFSMFHTGTRVRQRTNYLDPEHPIESCNLAYSIGETPFKRDIVKELCDAAHRNDIKINLYYSHPDWYDADFRPYCFHPFTVDAARTTSDFGIGSYDAKKIRTPNPTREEKDRMMARHRGQISELLTNYGKIDMICFDMWLGRYVWPETKETVKMMRRLQPDVMIRARGIGNYGDYYQPEEFVPEGKENTNMPWMSICLLGDIFAYDPVAEHYKGTQWVVSHLVDCVAKGGSFMVCIGPDANGQFHPEAVRQLEAVGEWLKVNGEGIYETRAREVWKSGDIRFTRSKDNKQVYAFVETFPDSKELIIPSVTPAKKSKVRLLGYNKPLKWQATDDGGIKVEIPDALQSSENRPCEYAWAFRIENGEK